MYLTQSLNRAVMVNPHGVATIFRDREHSWLQCAERIRRLAAGLAALGIGKGDRVAILALNSDRYFEAMFAIPALGAIIVPVNTRLAPPEIDYILKDSGARMLMLDTGFVPMLDKLTELAAVRDIVHLDADAPGGGLRGFESLLAADAPLPEAAANDDVAGIFYTGGTTGRSKGVMLTHRNLVSNAIMVVTAFDYRPGAVYIHSGPMFHLADGASTYAVTMIAGTHVFIPRFDPADLLKEVARTRVTNALLVPTMAAAVANHPDVTTTDTSSWRICAYGASPMPEAVLQRIRGVLPTVTFVHAYGMTEAAPLVTSSDLHKEPQGERLKSCGRAALMVDIRIADANDQAVPRGTMGEVQVRGPNIMLGYWNQPEATRAALRGGWYHSGDGGIMDEEGYLYIVDRLKDMIISGGENIYSAEVESAISTLPGVAEVAVIGIPDDKWGETVHAVVVPRTGATITAEDVIAHCRTQIAGYKCPRSVEIRNLPLPLSGAGKVLKGPLREPFWAGREKRVA
ncbi:long-chain-fatty-acid--CoA ligase [Rhodopila sp.]|jgi:long-chain acyl-CoA synthetase|uniref:long-chain-fatty-acid--CoA ligase n=1 Tax=Rhodopila sp. TaxID=2480087 RepID=UPI002C1149FF|nr:long-chain-fatty-acid--CoA ligase [Rhodopila sp.]HVZ10407.1 long-chain-fatty-acid--CoA ligase [Rhodopila sp.]